MSITTLERKIFTTTCLCWISDQLSVFFISVSLPRSENVLTLDGSSSRFGGCSSLTARCMRTSLGLTKPVRHSFNSLCSRRFCWVWWPAVQPREEFPSLVLVLLADLPLVFAAPLPTANNTAGYTFYTVDNALMLLGDK